MLSFKLLKTKKALRTVAIDATHFEARDRAKAQEKKPKAEPKKRGRKSKAEKETYEKQKQEEEAQQSLYEKTIADQLDVPVETLRSEIPMEPAWEFKKIVKGRTFFAMDSKGILPWEPTANTFFNR
jgi:transposase